MTHLYKESDFEVGASVELVSYAYNTGKERHREVVSIIRVKHGTIGNMKGRLQVTVQRENHTVVTVLPAEVSKVTVLEPISQ